MKSAIMILVVIVGGLLLMAPADVDTFEMLRATSLAARPTSLLEQELYVRVPLMKARVKQYEQALKSELARRGQ